MKFQDLIKLYEKKKAQYGAEAFRYNSQIIKRSERITQKGLAAISDS